MFEISVQAEFAAAHSLVIGGNQEPLHGHNWHVTVTVAGPKLDGDGLLCDFHVVERALRELAAGMHNGNLNDLSAFGPRGLNPSAENIARYIADQLIASLEGRLAPVAAISAVRVTEAPGCAATYYPGKVAQADACQLNHDSTTHHA